MSSDNVRKTLHSAYSFIRSIESNRAVSGLTLDHMIQAQITSLKRGSTEDILDGLGQSVGNKPSRWDQLDTLEKEVMDVVDAITKAGNDPAKLAALGLDPNKQSTDGGT